MVQINPQKQQIFFKYQFLLGWTKLIVLFFCRRLSLESNQLAESVDELRFGRSERNSNVRATLLVDFLNRDSVLRNLNGSAPDPIPDPLEPLPVMTVEPEVIAEPESLNQDGLGLSLAETDQVSFFLILSQLLFSWRFIISLKFFFSKQNKISKNKVSFEFLKN